MTEKILLFALSVLSSTLVGYFLSKRLKQRAEYYKNFVELIDYCITEVRFRRNAIGLVMKSFVSCNDTPLVQNIDEYIKGLDEGNFNYSQGVLNKQELKEIEIFFSSLGTLDPDTQNYELAIYRDKFSAIEMEVTAKKNKYAPLYIKLAFFFGLAVGIILL